MAKDSTGQRNEFWAIHAAKAGHPAGLSFCMSCSQLHHARLKLRTRLGSNPQKKRGAQKGITAFHGSPQPPQSLQIHIANWQDHVAAS
jgi:hypothetical protein